MNQKDRTQTLDDMRAGNIRILVCSDVAGRGIDVDHVSHVFNHDVPMNSDDYVHRIGRTGRAGRSGRAFTLAVSKYDDKFLAAVEGTIGNKIPEHKTPENSKPKAADKPSERKSAPKKKAPRQKDRVQDDDVVGFGDDIPAFMK